MYYNQNQNLPVVKGWTSQQVEAIKRTVAINATNEELTMFLYLSGKTGLDPFSNEIWFIQINGKNRILTGRDGYLKIANNHPAFRGIESDAVYSNDVFTRRMSNNGDNIIRHEYSLKDRGELLGAYAKVYRSDRDFPAFFLAPMRDYDKKSGAWLQYPHAMIIKVAEAMALKRAFAISGLCTQEELIPEEHTPNNAQAVRINILWRDYVAYCGGNQEQAKSLMFDVIGCEKSSKEFDERDVSNLENFLLQKEINEEEEREVIEVES